MSVGGGQLDNGSQRCVSTSGKHFPLISFLSKWKLQLTAKILRLSTILIVFYLATGQLSQ